MLKTVIYGALGGCVPPINTPTATHFFNLES